MKKFFTAATAARLILLFETTLCAVSTLTVFMVNGTDSFSSDHVLLLVLLALTASSAFMLKGAKKFYHKIAMWLSLLPLFFIGQQAVTAFLLSHLA